MKFKFRNLGPIEETELDLHPLTIIIGPNNPAKTYIAYSLYGILKRLRTNYDSYSEIKSLLHKESDTTFSVKKDELIEKLKSIFEAETKKFKKRLTFFFQDSSRKLFSKTDYELLIEDQEIDTAISTVISGMRKGLSLEVHYDEAPFPKISFHFRPTTEEKLEDSVDLGLLIFLKLLSSNIFHRPYLLPAERNTLITTYKLFTYSRYRELDRIDRIRLIDRKNKKLYTDRRITQGMLFPEITEDFRPLSNTRFPEPIEDFINSLSEISLSHLSSLRLLRQRGDYSKIVEKIENQLQNTHKIEFNQNDLFSEITLKVNEQLTIDLYNASSSIKQVAPFLMYLKCMAEPNDLLIIDEPEMNLHPENQVKFLEAVAILVNSGFKVLMTTHSPYFMSHLNNLVSGRIEDQKILKKQAKELYLGDPKAFLKMEQVGAYEMKNNKLVSLKDPDYGIRWDTLSDVSVDVQQKFFAISEIGNKDDSKKKSPRNTQE